MGIYDNYNKTTGQMKVNSAKWSGANDEEKKRLETENQKLGASIGGVYNKESGTWSDSRGGNLYDYRDDPAQKTTDYLSTAQKNAEIANNQAVNKAVNTFNHQKSSVNNNARAQAQQAFIQNQQAMRGMPEQMKKLGATGGLSESTVLGQNTAYQNAQQAVLQNKMNKLNDIDNSISNARIQGAADNANSASEFAKLGAQYNENNIDRELSQYNNDRSYNYQLGRDEKDDAYRDKVYDRDVFVNNRDFGYQQTRDERSDMQWDKSFDYQLGRDEKDDAYRDKVYDRDVFVNNRDFGYQQTRDGVSDMQWNKSYNQQTARDSADAAYKYSALTAQNKQNAIDNGYRNDVRNDSLKQQDIETFIKTGQWDRLEAMGYDVSYLKRLADYQTFSD